MPERYHIKTAPTPDRFHRVGKFATVDAREDCSRCSNCVKPRCCFDVYRKEVAHNRDPLTVLTPLYDCRGCLSCVMGCTKGLLELSINPEYLAMGDEYWTPDIIATTWNQSETGRIPVSGAGYRGRFSGPGFDSIWTDMSEIVRPTRDGIHGREYISTTVDIGYKPMRLSFADDGRMETQGANLIETQFPAILDVPPWPMGASSGPLAAARAAAAAALKTLAVVADDDLPAVGAETLRCVVPLLNCLAQAGACGQVLPQVRMVEIADGPDVAAIAAAVRVANPELPVAARLDLTPAVSERIADLSADDGAAIKVFHLCADLHGREKGPDQPRHIKDALRAVHGQLVKGGIRDEITVIVGGGIGLPEHMAKAIICGADLVAVGTPLLVALGCRVCRDADCARACPAGIDRERAEYATQRMVNLMGAWHSQMIEVLGAMGIREVRRLRGETGRAIFQEDMEREAFGDLIRK
jgi:ferredoxin